MSATFFVWTQRLYLHYCPTMMTDNKNFSLASTTGDELRSLLCAGGDDAFARIPFNVQSTPNPCEAAVIAFSMTGEIVGFVSYIKPALPEQRGKLVPLKLNFVGVDINAREPSAVVNALFGEIATKPFMCGGERAVEIDYIPQRCRPRLLFALSVNRLLPAI